MTVTTDGTATELATPAADDATPAADETPADELAAVGRVVL